MNTKRLTLGLILMPLLLIAAGYAVGDDDDDKGFGSWWKSSRLDVAPVNNALYQEECGSCHFAYQPGLLPTRSWERMMNGLEDHFGENAELEEATRKELLQYLSDNAAERSNYKRSKRINGSLPSDSAPLRISETRYFKGKHDEIPKRLVSGNEKVGSWSNCQACHVKADTGSYNEHEVNIPGVGRWDD